MTRYDICEGYDIYATIHNTCKNAYCLISKKDIIEIASIWSLEQMVPLVYSAYRSSMTRYDICEGYDICATIHNTCKNAYCLISTKISSK